MDSDKKSERKENTKIKENTKLNNELGNDFDDFQDQLSERSRINSSMISNNWFFSIFNPDQLTQQTDL